VVILNRTTEEEAFIAKCEELFIKLDADQITNDEMKELTGNLLTVAAANEKALEESNSEFDMLGIATTIYKAFIESEGLNEQFSVFSEEILAELSQELDSNKEDLTLAEN
jgi:hypothetical protein